MTAQGPLYLGFDLSTQQLKAVIISSNLNVLHEANVDFDTDLAKYGAKKGVHVNVAESKVYAPVAMWLDAIDIILERLREKGTPFNRIQGISGAGQQHGSVYWSHSGEKLLGSLEADRTLRGQLFPQGFAYPWSPNWQDSSTQAECDDFNSVLGGEANLALVTGSKAHHRFTGPQIESMRKKHPDIYQATSRISLVSSFLASVFLGGFAPIDTSDVCGMNLWDINSSSWSEPLFDLAAGSGEVRPDGGGSLGTVSKYFVERYGFSRNCQITPFTGDNPATVLAIPLKPLDAIISLGTSTTFLMITPKYVPDPSYHVLNHPTTTGMYLFMLCYKNGGLAREKVRDDLPTACGDNSWNNFDKLVASSPSLGQSATTDAIKLGLYFLLPEIVPNVRAGIWRFNYLQGRLEESSSGWKLPEDDARAIVESQILSIRIISQRQVSSNSENCGPRFRRIYLVGGGSMSPSISRLVADILGGSEGVYRLSVGGNACALGGAYKAVWGLERKPGENIEEFIGSRWHEKDVVSKIDTGNRPELWERYKNILPIFEEMEKKVLAGEDQVE